MEEVGKWRGEERTAGLDIPRTFHVRCGGRRAGAKRQTALRRGGSPAAKNNEGCREKKQGKEPDEFEFDAGRARAERRDGMKE